MYKQKLTFSISFEEFCKQDTILYCIKQLRSSKFKNLIPQEKISSTQKSYAYALWRFNNWLQGRNFEFYQLEHTSADLFKKERKSVQLNGLEHFFNLYLESHNSDQEFAKLIKRYL